MSVRQYTIAWISAAFLSVMVILGLATLGGNGPYSERARDVVLGPWPDSDVMFIGSSLTHVSIGQSTRDLFGSQGLTMQKFNAAAVRGETVLRAVEHSIALDTKTIFIEIDPLIYDFVYKSAFMAQVGNFTESTRRGARILFRDVDRLHFLMGGVDRLKYVQGWDLELLRRERGDGEGQFPPRLLLSFSQFEDQWRRVQRLAAENGTELLFVTFPRSEMAVAQTPRPSFDVFREEAVALAERLDVPLFEPAISWPNSYFFDGVHVNDSGRARYEDEFNAWVTSRSAGEVLQ